MMTGMAITRMMNGMTNNASNPRSPPGGASVVNVPLHEPTTVVLLAGSVALIE